MASQYLIAYSAKHHSCNINITGRRSGSVTRIMGRLPVVGCEQLRF